MVVINQTYATDCIAHRRVLDPTQARYAVKGCPLATVEVAKDPSPGSTASSLPIKPVKLKSGLGATETPSRNEESSLEESRKGDGLARISGADLSTSEPTAPLTYLPNTLLVENKSTTYLSTPRLNSFPSSKERSPDDCGELSEKRYDDALTEAIGVAQKTSHLISHLRICQSLH